MIEAPAAGETLAQTHGQLTVGGEATFGSAVKTPPPGS
jgi:hypothetical protein